MRKKTPLIALLLFVAMIIKAQINIPADLTFDQHIISCENKWIAFPPKDDGAMSFGFVYLDYDAGFTYNLEGFFTVDEKGKYKPAKDETKVMKYRLSGNEAKVALITESRFEELDIEKIPDWIKYYSVNDKNSFENLVKRGSCYNAVGECEKALECLLKVYEKSPHQEGLEFELAYAYNHLGKYSEAVEVLAEAIENDSTNFWFYRELGFSAIMMQALDLAEGIYSYAIGLTNDPVQKVEISFNMAVQYFHQKKKNEFDKWIDIVLEYEDKNSSIFNSALEMKESILQEENNIPNN